MVIREETPIQIDLEQFKVHINIPGRMALSLQFDTPSRRFYLSLMALVVDRLKQADSISFVLLSPHVDVLALLVVSGLEDVDELRSGLVLSKVALQEGHAIKGFLKILPLKSVLCGGLLQWFSALVDLPGKYQYHN